VIGDIKLEKLVSGCELSFCTDDISKRSANDLFQKTPQGFRCLHSDIFEGEGLRHLFAALRILYFFLISAAQQQALVIFPCHRGCIIRDDFCLRVNFLQKFLDALFFFRLACFCFGNNDRIRASDLILIQLGIFRHIAAVTVNIHNSDRREKLNSLVLDLTQIFYNPGETSDTCRFYDQVFRVYHIGNGQHGCCKILFPDAADALLCHFPYIFLRSLPVLAKTYAVDSCGSIFIFQYGKPLIDVPGQPFDKCCFSRAQKAGYDQYFHTFPFSVKFSNHQSANLTTGLIKSFGLSLMRNSAPSR